MSNHSFVICLGICPHLKAHVLEVCPITSDGIWIIAVKIGRKKGKYENSARKN
jgi:hypothetical protein